MNLLGEDPFKLWVIGTTLLTMFVYWFFGGIYTMLDLTNKPAVLRKYKIQQGTNEPVDRARLIKVCSHYDFFVSANFKFNSSNFHSQVLTTVLINQVFVGFPLAVGSYHLMKFRGFADLRELPTFHWVLAELAFCIIIEEIGFYYSHRFLHGRFIYKHIHKQHHEWTAPISVTAIYCHPIEHIFSNLLPPMLGVFLLGSHVATAWLWFSLAILSTLNAHSGYHLPFFPSPEAHDFHHLK